MADFTDKMRLKEQAEEDIYFAKRDRERVKALRDKRLAEQKKKNSPEKLEDSEEDKHKPARS